MEIGEKVSIKDGPFAGYEGEVLEQLSSGNFKVKIEIFGRITEIEVSEKSCVQKESKPLPKPNHKGKTVKELEWWIQRLTKEPAGMLYEQFLAFQETLHNTSDTQLDLWYNELKEMFLAPDFSEKQEKIRNLKRRSYKSWWLENQFDKAISSNLENEIKKAEALEELIPKLEALHQVFLDNGWRSLTQILKRKISIDFELFPLNEAPTDFPWSFEVETPEFIINELFKPIEKKANQFVETLKSEILCVLGLKINTAYYLLYVGEYYNGAYYNNAISTSFLLGEMPDSELTLTDKVQEIGWKVVPADLQLFYSVHGQFGNFSFYSGSMDDSYAIKSVERLSEMAFMNEVVAKQNAPEAYDFKNLLEFYSNGDGNGYHFYKEELEAQTSDQVVWWDHETREMGAEGTFWDFLNNQALSNWFGH